MMNGAEGPAMELPDDEVPPVSAVPAPTAPPYRRPMDRGVPKLGRGIVWSDLVREMEEEHAARLARAAEKVTALRPGPLGSGDPDEGVEEAA